MEIDRQDLPLQMYFRYLTKLTTINGPTGVTPGINRGVIEPGVKT
jgi:hypothetical protein